MPLEEAVCFSEKAAEGFGKTTHGEWHGRGEKAPS